MFSKDDFQGDNLIRLSVIIMCCIGQPPLTSFHDLHSGEKKQFNKALNEFISNLGESWENKLLTEFNEVCQDYLFNDEFNPSHVTVKTVDMTRKLLLNDEQKVFLEEQEKNLLTGYNESSSEKALG